LFRQERAIQIENGEAAVPAACEVKQRNARNKIRIIAPFKVSKAIKTGAQGNE